MGSDSNVGGTEKGFSVQRQKLFSVQRVHGVIALLEAVAHESDGLRVCARLPVLIQRGRVSMAPQRESSACQEEHQGFLGVEAVFGLVEDGRVFRSGDIVCDFLVVVGRETVQ